MREPIATRILSLDGETEVLVKLYAPEPRLVRKVKTFASRYEIVNLNRRPIVGRGIGEDSLQALQLAIDSVHARLMPYRERLTWLGGWWLGFSRRIPSGYSPEIDARYERAVDDLSERLLRKWKERDRRSRGEGKRGTRKGSSAAKGTRVRS